MGLFSPFNKFRKEAESGNADAQFKLGVCYYNGVGVKQDTTEAVRWFCTAAKQGHLQAQFSLGVCRYRGWGVALDQQEAARWFRKAAEQGHIQAQFHLAVCHYRGWGINRDRQEAIRWLRMAAERGSVEAKEALKKIAAAAPSRPSVPAVEVSPQAAAPSDAIAQFDLGNLYAKGEGVKQDWGEAVRWFRKAAEQGLAVAQWRLGNCCDDGEGVERDQKEAVRWYHKAAAQGLVAAQWSLGNCYATGEGVDQDLFVAATWWRKAEKQDGPVAQDVPRPAQGEGEKIEPDQQEAVNRFHRAAEHGFGYAKRNLGFHYTVQHALEELISDAQDEKVSRIDVGFERVDYCRYRMTVADDSPEGFKELADAQDNPAPSYKKSKRGGPNFGEKGVIAICDAACISTTTGTIIFEHNERRYFRVKRAAGTLFEGYVTSSRKEYEQVCQKMLRVIPSEDVVLTFNHRVIEPRTPVASFRATLPTITVNKEGERVCTERMTTVNLYEVLMGEEASIYERGIPVVKTGDLYHYDVGQPPSLSRDKVPPKSLKLLRTLALDHTHGLIPEDNITASWVREGLEGAKQETVTSVLHKTFGKQRAIADPADREAENRLQAEGFTIIPADAFNKAAWLNIMAAGAAEAAGTIRPTAKPSPPNPPKPLDPKELTPAMKLVEEYAVLIALHVLGSDITVDWVNDPACNSAAHYGPRGGNAGALTLNVARLWQGWFERPPATTWEIESLLIHGFASNHLNEANPDALTEYGVKLSVLKLRQPELFARFR